jgi:DNA polymerase-3 subunit gamma/tau
MIADEEQIKITDSALMLIARLAAGAMRDALSMLELFYMADHEVDEAEASERLGVVGRSVVFSLLEAICEKNSEKALGVIAEAYDNSKDLGVLCSELSDSLRDILIAKYSSSPEKLIDATGSDIEKIKSFSKALTDEKIIYCSDVCEDMQNRLSKAVFSRRTIIETGILRMCEEKLSQDISTLLTRISALEEKIAVLSAGGAIKQAPIQTKPAEPVSSEPVYEAQIPDAPIPDMPPMPTDADMPFDGPYMEEAPKQTAPKPIAPRPLTPRPLSIKPQQTSSDNRKPMTSYAEFVEEVELVDKMCSSLLEGGRAYITGENICEIELTNAIAPVILSAPDKMACIENALSKVLDFAPRVKIKLAENGNAETEKTDLSSLL